MEHCPHFRSGVSNNGDKHGKCYGRFKHDAQEIGAGEDDSRSEKIEEDDGSLLVRGVGDIAWAAYNKMEKPLIIGNSWLHQRFEIKPNRSNVDG